MNFKFGWTELKGSEGVEHHHKKELKYTNCESSTWRAMMFLSAIVCLSRHAITTAQDGQRQSCWESDPVDCPKQPHPFVHTFVIKREQDVFWANKQQFTQQISGEGQRNTVVLNDFRKIAIISQIATFVNKETMSKVTFSTYWGWFLDCHFYRRWTCSGLYLSFFSHPIKVQIWPDPHFVKYMYLCSVADVLFLLPGPRIE